MNEIETYQHLKQDVNLQEAISRKERKRPQMPEDLNERVMYRLSERKPQQNALLLALRFIASTAAIVLIGLFIYVNETPSKVRNNHSHFTTNWQGGSTLKNLYTKNLPSTQNIPISYTQFKHYYYEKK